jgi:hypothetical protein
MIGDIWDSFRRMPVWVQIWVAFILVPVNLAPLLFLAEPYAVWVACLSIGGMVPNVAIMVAERGLSKRMALPHLVIWTPLVGLLGWLLMGLTGADQTYVAMLVLVLVVDLISLGFDFPDAVKWLRGDRAIA